MDVLVTGCVGCRIIGQQSLCVAPSAGRPVMLSVPGEPLPENSTLMRSLIWFPWNTRS